MDASTRFLVRSIVRRGNRLRWRAKARNVARYPRYGSTADRLRYVLLSPEVGDFSWRLSEIDEVACDLARLLDEPDVARVRFLLEEAYEDEVLWRDYRDRRRMTLLPRDMKLGNRTIWWTIIRLRRPQLVVETGVWYGLGSLVILRALERNAQEHGVEGRLLSFEPDPTMGWLVPARLTRRWTIVRSATEEALETMLEGHEVDLFIHDTPSTPERESFELRQAYAHAAPGAVLASGNGTNTAALPELCRELGLEHRQIDLPSDCWYLPTGVGLTALPRVVMPAPELEVAGPATGRFARDQGCSRSTSQAAESSATLR